MTLKNYRFILTMVKNFLQITLTLAIILWGSLLGFAPVSFAQTTKYYDPPASFNKAELKGKDFSGQIIQAAEFAGANLEFTDFHGAQLQGTIFSAARMTHANLSGADFSYGMTDQVEFTGSDLSDAVFVETIMLRSTFQDVKITGADFTDALLDGFQRHQLCAIASGVNPKTGVLTQDSLRCKLPK